MKITIIGAAGVRTPLILRSITKRQDRLGLDELALMDIDRERLELIGALTKSTEESEGIKFRITRSTDARLALSGADYVITTFRVGGIESRVIDERVPLNHGVLGQETTGAGGFAIGIRSIPVLIDYIKLMQEVCPKAWLINFANPAGMLTEAVIRYTGWQRAVGICDGPASMHVIISAFLETHPKEVYLDYFGLNHLGWIKRVMVSERDHLPDLLRLIKSSGSSAGLPFEPDLIANLGMIPNEYLYYYYCNAQAVSNIMDSGECRGEQVARENLNLFSNLRDKFLANDLVGMQASYQDYLEQRGSTYMVRETGRAHEESMLDPQIIQSLQDEGYAGVALDLIEGLLGNQPLVQILNVASHGAIPGMDDLDVVEVPAKVSRDSIQPIATGNIPCHCMGLILQVKDFEHLTIEAALEKSYPKALLALTNHPLIRDYQTAKLILDEYIQKHGDYFPPLNG